MSWVGKKNCPFNKMDGIKERKAARQEKEQGHEKENGREQKQEW